MTDKDRPVTLISGDIHSCDSLALAAITFYEDICCVWINSLDLTVLEEPDVEVSGPTSSCVEVFQLSIPVLPLQGYFLHNKILSQFSDSLLQDLLGSHLFILYVFYHCEVKTIIIIITYA